AAPARSGAPAAVRRTLDRLRRAARAVARGDAGPVRRRLASLAERQMPGAAGQHAGVAAECSLLEVMHDVLQVNYAAAARYRPLTYPGPVTLFRAQIRAPHAPTSPDLGWARWALGGVHVHHVPGGHMTMFDEPYVRLVARELQSCLDAIAVPEETEPVVASVG
ncbi:MAG: thioesterase domain-containing protein, partial [Gemmatirosa sp.]